MDESDCIDVRNFLEEGLPRVEEVIAKTSSQVAPDEFLHNELRRRVNYNLYHFLDGAFYIPSGDYLQRLIENIEHEYQCYFDHENFLRKYDQFQMRHDHLLAGINNQIEGFITREGNVENYYTAMEKMGLVAEGGFSAFCSFDPPEQFSSNLLEDNFRKYLIGIGLLYPLDENTVIRHPNFVMGHVFSFSFHADAPLLNRDHIRAPYHYARSPDEVEMTDAEMWNFWQDLACLSMVLTRSRGYYAKYFKDRDNALVHLRYHGDEWEKALPWIELGKRLLPERYLSLDYDVDRKRCGKYVG